MVGLQVICIILYSLRVDRGRVVFVLAVRRLVASLGSWVVSLWFTLLGPCPPSLDCRVVENATVMNVPMADELVGHEFIMLVSTVPENGGVLLLMPRLILWCSCAFELGVALTAIDVVLMLGLLFRPVS